MGLVILVLLDGVAAAVGAVGISGEGENFAVVNEVVNLRGRDEVVAEGFASAAGGQVGGDHDQALFVAGCEELEE